MRDDEAAALKAQKLEIEEFMSGAWSVEMAESNEPRMVSDIVLTLELSMSEALKSLEGAKRRRGRPDILASGNPATIDSYRAFRFVQREMQYFRKRVGRVRVPKDARDCFIELASRLYPNADDELVVQHLRRIAKMPIEEEFRTENWRAVNYESDKNS